MSTPSVILVALKAMALNLDRVREPKSFPGLGSSERYNFYLQQLTGMSTHTSLFSFVMSENYSCHLLILLYAVNL